MVVANWHYLLAFTLLGQVHGGCKSSDAGEPAATLSSTEGYAKTLDLAKEDEQDLYLKILQAQVSAGVNVPPEQLHNAHAAATCTSSGGLESCEARVRLGERDLAAPFALAREVAEQIWAFARQVRPDLASEQQFYSEISCDYLGKKSPPYVIEEVNCQVATPHAINEALFDGYLSEELSDLSRGEKSYGAGTSNLLATLTCELPASSQRAICAVRSTEAGAVNERVREISDKNAPKIARILLGAAHDLVRLSADKNKSTTEAPKSATASLQCSVDSSRLRTEGVRQFRCRARI